MPTRDELVVCRTLFNDFKVVLPILVLERIAHFF